MFSQIEQTEQSEADIAEIIAFISEDNGDAAKRFIDAAEAGFVLLASMPLMGRIVPFQSQAAQGIRMGHIQGFECYLIFYRAVEQGIQIMRVLHGARDIEQLFGE